MPGALEGIRVLDFSHALAGPYCTQLMAMYGADIYKLESPEGGELGRGWGPPFAGGEAHFFLGLNRGKRGISIDLKKPEGRALCLRLIDQMDVLLENFRPGAMDRLGLGYAAIHTRNPRLVYCSISGYGQNGPLRDDAAMDLIVEASSGYMSITGTESGDLVRSGYALADINAGLFALNGILMALRHRDRTGEGQYVDVSMFDGMVSAMSSNYMAHLGSGKVPRPLGSGFPTVVPYRVFRAADRDFAIAVGSEKLWSAFCDAIGRPTLTADPRFATNALRIENRAALETLLGETFHRHPAQHWKSKLDSAGIPCSLILNFAEVTQHPQSAVREMFPRVRHPKAGDHLATGAPVKMSATPARADGVAPGLGQHTVAALQDLLGATDAEIEALATSGAIR